MTTSRDWFDISILGWWMRGECDSDLIAAFLVVAGRFVTSALPGFCVVTPPQPWFLQPPGFFFVMSGELVENYLEVLSTSLNIWYI